MTRRRRAPRSTLVVPPRPIPPMFSSRRSKRRDAGLAELVRGMGGEGRLDVHERSCGVTFEGDDPFGDEGTCTCAPLALEFGARA